MLVTAAVTWAGVAPSSSGALTPNKAELDAGVAAVVGVVVAGVAAAAGVAGVAAGVATCDSNARVVPDVFGALADLVVAAVVVVVVTVVVVVVTATLWWRPVEL